MALLTAPLRPLRDERELMGLARRRSGEWGNVVVIAWSDHDGGWSGVWCRAGTEARRFAGAELGSPGASGPGAPVNDGGNAGAADVFRAGLLWARLRNWEWERGLRFAAVAATLKPAEAGGGAGGMESVPRLEEIEAVLLRAG